MVDLFGLGRVYMFVFSLIVDENSKLVLWFDDIDVDNRWWCLCCDVVVFICLFFVFLYNNFLCIKLWCFLFVWFWFLKCLVEVKFFIFEMLFFWLIFLNDGDEDKSCVSCWDLKLGVFLKRVVFILFCRVLFLLYFFIVGKVVLSKEIVFVNLCFNSWVDLWLWFFLM